ncbi:MAG TPA: ribonuclease Z [Gemmatimonadaceae bacterium]|nr:ribonuclease Z [Gemmatimonadaceae bacterium]
MSLTVRFLGTSASRPTVERNVTSIAVTREGETLLFDCGEGTQRQMMRYGISFALRDIFFTHMHADHMLGVIGLFRTLSLQGREDPMTLWGPPGSEALLTRAIALGTEKEKFPIEYREITAETPVKRKDYSVLPYPVEHAGKIALGYAIVEDTRLGRFNPGLARELGIPEGPMWGLLHRGQSVTLPDGRVIDASDLVGPSRPGRRVVFGGDGRPCAGTVEAARDADLLIHEATFADEEAQRALETGHSTAREAAQVASAAGVKQLVLTHLSARYSQSASDLLREAREVFPDTIVARDGMEIDVLFRESREGSPD